MMKDWKEIKLGEIAKVISGFAFKSKDFLKDKGISAIKIKNIKNGNVDLSETDFVDNSFLSINQRYHLNRNDILVSLTGSHMTQPNSVVGRVALYRHDFTSLLNQRAGKVIPNETLIDKKFLYCFLSQDRIKETIAMRANGAANQANVSPGDVEDLDILLPPLETQQKIASILSAYDDLIENNLRRIKLLEEMAAITYKEWFVNNSLSNRVINEKEIEFQAIENILDFSMNGGWGKDESEGNDIIPAYVVRGTDIPNVLKGNFTNLPLRFHSVKNIETRELKYGDVIIEISNGNINSIGRSLFCDKDFLKMFNHKVICASFCKMLRAKDNLKSILLDAHIKYLHKTDKMSVYKSQGANGINNFRSDEMIKKENIPFPINRDDLKLLANGLEIFNTLNSNLRYQNRLLKESRDILLPRLMSGAVVA